MQSRRTHTHTLTHSVALLERAHITHTQCLPKSAHDAKDSVQQKKKKCKTYRVSRLTHYTFHCAIIPLKAAQRRGGGKGSWIELNWVSLCRSTWLTFMSSELCDKLEQHPIKMRVLLKKLKYTHWHTHTHTHTQTHIDRYSQCDGCQIYWVTHNLKKNTSKVD